MRFSQYLLPTLRETPAEAEVVSHKLMLRAGLIRKAAAGIYTFLPLGYRVVKKIIRIVEEEMDRAGGQEVLMPIVQPAQIWQQTGRWKLYGEEMFRLQDRHGRDFCLGPTHEEIITTVVKNEVRGGYSLLQKMRLRGKRREGGGRPAYSGGCRPRRRKKGIHPGLYHRPRGGRFSFRAAGKINQNPFLYGER